MNYFNKNFRLNYLKNLFLGNPNRIFLCYPKKCNLRCKQCNLWKYQKEDCKAYKNKKEIIDGIYKWIGPFTLNFTSGGEPFLNKDLPDFLKYCSDKNIKINLITNGTLIDEKLAKKLSRIKNLNLVISLDGARPETHDYLRGVKGTYKKVLNTIKLLHKYNFYNINISFTLNAKNINEIEEIYNFCILNKINSLSITPIILNSFYINLNSKKEFEKNLLWPKYKDAKKAIDLIIYFKKNGKKKLIWKTIKEFENYKEYFKNPYSKKLSCNIDPKTIKIFCDGSIGICNKVGFSKEKIFTSSVKKLYQKIDFKKNKKIISNCYLPCKVSSCNRNDSFLNKITSKFNK